MTINIILMISVILAFSFFATISYSDSYAQLQSCSIELLSGQEIMHPGEFLHLKSNFNSNNEVDYTWKIDGPVTKDYDDLTQESTLLGASRNLEEPTPITPADLKQEDLSFYWNLDPTDAERSISLEIKNNNNSVLCKETKNFIVQMGNDINNQAEDFYVEENHPKSLDRYGPTNVLSEHNSWHINNSFWEDPDYTEGSLFFDFHNLFLAHFDKFREHFGYKKIEQWDPSKRIDTGIDIDHNDRSIFGYRPDSLPSWFKPHPGVDDELLPDRQKINFDDGTPIDCEIVEEDRDGIQDELEDFDTNQNLLGCILSSSYHDERHGAVGGRGGDMNDPATAPQDPIFWRLHKFIDNVSQNHTKLTNQNIVPVSLDAEAAGISRINEESEPPRVFSQNPFRLYPYLTSLPTITEQEKYLFGEIGIPAISAEFNEPVTGVQAKDFTVNGSPATNVSGTAQGPYVFIGFDYPKAGPINVTLSSGNITDTQGNNFEGTSWKYYLVESEIDKDKDGIQDGIEVNTLKTNPRSNDTDGDGISEGLELINPCLSPVVNDVHRMTIANMNHDNASGLEPPLDHDADGLSNVKEVTELHTDPCDVNSGIDSSSEGLTSRESNNITDTENNLPFMLFLKRSGGLTGDEKLLYIDSLSSKLMMVDNGQLITNELDKDMMDNIKRIVNSSLIFDANTYYPAPTGSTDYKEFMAAATLNGRANSVYWTEVSTDVPDELTNLPYILDYIFGGSQLKNE